MGRRAGGYSLQIHRKMKSNSESFVSTKLSDANNGAFILGATLLSLLVVSNVPLVLAVKLVVILFAQVFTGKEFYLYFVKSRSISGLEIAAVGFSLGALIWLIFDQVFIFFSLPHFGWVVPFLVAVLTHLRYRAKIIHEKIVSSPDKESVAWIIVASLVGLSGEWVWPFLFACVATAVLITRKTTSINKKSYDKIAFAVLACAGAATLITRPTIWWITQTDTHFYQAISTSVAKWGFRDSILTAGYSLKYHWFPYAWTGMVNRISDAPDWVVLTRVGPLVATLCIISLVWTITLRLIENKGAAVFGILVFAASPVFGDWSLSISLAMFGSYSQHFATIWLLPILLWMIDVARDALRAPWALASILLIGLVGGKVSHAAVALVAILGFEVIRFFQRRELRRSILLESVVAVVTVIGATLFLFGTGGSLTWRPASWVPYVQGDLYDFHGIKLVLATTILLIGMLSIVFVALLRGMFLDKNLSSVFAGVLSSVIAGVGLSNFSNFPTDPNGLFFVHSPLIIAFALIVTQLFLGSDSKGSRISISPSFRLASVIGGCALLLGVVIPDLNSGSVSAVLLRTSRSLTPVIAFLLIILLLFVRKNTRTATQVSLYSLALASLIVISVGSFVVKTGFDIPKNYRNFEQDGPTFVESPDLRALSIWFDENSTSEDIYASNYFCEGSACSSADYSRKSLVAAIIKRRSLLQSPWLAASYSSGGKETKQSDFSDRLLVSVSFATAPTQAEVMLLKNWGVDWYVVDLEVSPTNYWANSDAKVYDSNSYLVIDLNKVRLD
ncbi:MAG: hypothetical protein EBX80_04185 [Acidimicrobiia bacterium]|nr:hypothetical protein [Acidimicrobiia bacterium]